MLDSLERVLRLLIQRQNNSDESQPGAISAAPVPRVCLSRWWSTYTELIREL